MNNNLTNTKEDIIRRSKFTFSNKVLKKNRLSIFLVATLLLFHDTLAFGLIRNENIVKYLLFSIVFILFLKLTVIDKKIKIRKKQLIILILLCFLIFSTMLINQDFTGGYFYMIILLVMAFFISQMINIDEFVESSIKCIVFFALYSLICYLLRPVIFHFRGFFPHFYNSAGLPLFHLGASVIVDNPSYSRLFGIFRESGVYQIFLNIAMIFELFLHKGGIRKRYILILFITIIFTFSTPGYISCIAILLIFVCSNEKKKKEKKNNKAIIVFMIIALLLTYNFSSVFSESVIKTFNKLFNMESSYIGRTTSIIVEFNLWKEKPFFGHGITNGMGISKELGEVITGGLMFNTSTVTGMMVNVGIFFTFIIFIMIYKFFLKIRSNIFGKLIIYGIFIFMISSQLMFYNAYLYALAFFSMSCTNCQVVNDVDLLNTIPNKGATETKIIDSGKL